MVQVLPHILSVQIAYAYIAGRLTNARFFLPQTCPRKYGLANLSDSKPRMGVAGNVHRAKRVNVHRANPIIVGSVTAAVANVFMSFVFAIRFMDSPALRTTLGSVLRTDLQNF